MQFCGAGGEVTGSSHRLQAGGRLRHHLRRNLGRGNAHILFVGCQAEGTLGRLFVDGAKKAKLFGEAIDVLAQRHTVAGLPAHADQADGYGHIGGGVPVWLVHGEDLAREALADRLRERYGGRVELSRPGMTVPL